MQEIPSVQSDNKGNMLNLPFALRFIMKSTAFMAHHQHLKPTEKFHFFEIPMDWLLRIHSIIGLVLAILLIKVCIQWVHAGYKIIKDKIETKRVA